ncbi:exodeoxyribonuclease VII large subunit [Prochlorococcus marinus]|uniref:exodeoxyribonuclease VII large subunit n=1 Tax=Prochlorococcus TaxID=1218 RepID=UPI0007B35CA2|nr:exodeoxyribonuclease VII large subunit [Prochlorococcus marinus]KZR78597.1 Exodeoxyribonuclease 7 large subunit [Prochlorococcus marinus str. MIT 1323]
MTAESLPNYSVRDLNAAIGTLLERGFAPRFLVEASVSKPQIKKGHLWLTLTDGNASITAVAWASKLQQLTYRPAEGDGVTVVGKLNFWATRASLAVQVIDMRPSLSTVLRQFEIVKARLLKEGIIDESKRKALPKYPEVIAILTSVPSSALADMLRTAKERWPLTQLLIIPIPVQGGVAKQIQSVLRSLANQHDELGIAAIVLARGGGSREDLMVFDDEDLCRDLASFPIPVVTGLGHEDDQTVADLVADHRAATPTAAMVALLPSRESAQNVLMQRRHRLKDHCNWLIRKERERLLVRGKALECQQPLKQIELQRIHLSQKHQLLQALSPELWLMRGFAIVKHKQGKTLRSVGDVSLLDNLTIQLSDGQINATTEAINQQRLST